MTVVFHSVLLQSKFPHGFMLLGDMHPLYTAKDADGCAKY